MGKKKSIDFLIPSTSRRWTTSPPLKYITTAEFITKLKGLLRIKNTVNKPYSSFHSKLTNLVFLYSFFFFKFFFPFFWRGLGGMGRARQPPETKQPKGQGYRQEWQMQHTWSSLTVGVRRRRPPREYCDDIKDLASISQGEGTAQTSQHKGVSSRTPHSPGYPSQCADAGGSPGTKGPGPQGAVSQEPSEFA